MVLVRDVRASVAWYCRLLDCQADHGLEEFERLTIGGEVLFMLHQREAAEHGASLDSGVVGNGFVLWIYVDSLETVYQRAKEIGAAIVVEPHENPQARWRECTIRDPSGYTLAIVEQ